MKTNKHVDFIERAIVFVICIVAVVLFTAAIMYSKYSIDEIILCCIFVSLNAITMFFFGYLTYEELHSKKIEEKHKDNSDNREK